VGRAVPFDERANDMPLVRSALGGGKALQTAAFDGAACFILMAADERNGDGEPEVAEPWPCARLWPAI